MIAKPPEQPTPKVLAYHSAHSATSLHPSVDRAPAYALGSGYFGDCPAIEQVSKGPRFDIGQVYEDSGQVLAMGWFELGMNISGIRPEQRKNFAVAAVHIETLDLTCDSSEGSKADDIEIGVRMFVSLRPCISIHEREDVAKKPKTRVDQGWIL